MVPPELPTAAVRGPRCGSTDAGETTLLRHPCAIRRSSPSDASLLREGAGYVAALGSVDGVEAARFADART